MKIGLKIKDQVSYLPKPEYINRNEKDYYDPSEDCPPVLFFKFDETVQSSNSQTIPIFKPRDCEFELTGTPILNETSQNPFTAIIVDLLVPISSKFHRTVKTRQSKVIVCYMDQLKKKDTFQISLANKNKQVLYEFTVKVQYISWNGLDRFIGTDWEGTRESAKKKEFKITSKFRKDAMENDSIFDTFGKGMENYDVFSSHAFNGPKPINSFLFIQPQESNEMYWIRLLEYVIILRKTEIASTFTGSTVEFFKTLDLREQVSILMDMCCSVSVNTTYLTDYILGTDGILEKTDDFSHICFGSGDCEDLSVFTYYSFMTFRTFGYETGYSHEVLKYLHNISTKFEMLLTVAALNHPQAQKRSICLHMCVLLITKKWLLDHVYVLDSNVKKGEIDDGIKLIKEYEEKNGNLNLEILNGTKKESLPNVLFGESTSFIYPYQTEDYVTKGLDKKKEYKRYAGVRRRQYQSKDYIFHERYITTITNYFIKHPAIQVNLPTLWFTYNEKSKRGGLTKGIESWDLYKQNQKDYADIKLIPQAHLADFPQSVGLIENLSTEKLPYTKLFYNETTSYPISIPKSLSGLTVMTMNEDVYPRLVKRIDVRTIVGIMYFEMLPNLKIVMVWFK